MRLDGVGRGAKSLGDMARGKRDKDKADKEKADAQAKADGQHRELVGASERRNDRGGDNAGQF